VSRILAPAAIFVAVVAGLGAVDETVHAVVGVGCFSLLVSRCCVAIDAGETGIIGGNLVAVVADRAVMGNRKVGMVEDGA